MIEPYAVGDDLARESVPLVDGRHHRIIPDQAITTTRQCRRRSGSEGLFDDLIPHPESGTVTLIEKRHDPQTEHVPVAVETDADRRVDRSVRDLPAGGL